TRKMWLSRLGHVDPFDSDRAHWVDTLHRWFDSQLYGIRNGILREPRVTVEVRPNEWRTSNRWPVATGPTTLHPRSDGTLGRHARKAVAAFTNNPDQEEADAITAGPNGSRLLYTTAPLAGNARVSGTTVVRVDVRTEVPTGQLGVFLVDYGSDERVLDSGDGARTLSTESCWGESVTYDDACYFDVARRLGTTPLQTLARGWARLNGAGHHKVTVELTPQDNVLTQGHRLGLVVVASSPDWVVTVDPTPSTYTVRLDKTSLRLPGRVAFNRFAPGAVSRVQAIPRRQAVGGALPVHRESTRLPS
ncbi:MAG TPA: CocE/NonD family hydrolase C-terminal non-catalytic domain-containing protein, partial [Nocardioidaceae bacterium]